MKKKTQEASLFFESGHVDLIWTKINGLIILQELVINNTRYVMYIMTGSVHLFLLTFYETMVMKFVSCHTALCKRKHHQIIYKSLLKNVR